MIIWRKATVKYRDARMTPERRKLIIRYKGPANNRTAQVQVKHSFYPSGDIYFIINELQERAKLLIEPEIIQDYSPYGEGYENYIVGWREPTESELKRIERYFTILKEQKEKQKLNK